MAIRVKSVTFGASTYHPAKTVVSEVVTVHAREAAPSPTLAAGQRTAPGEVRARARVRRPITDLLHHAQRPVACRRELGRPNARRRGALGNSACAG